MLKDTISALKYFKCLILAEINILYYLTSHSIVIINYELCRFSSHQLCPRVEMMPQPNQLYPRDYIVIFVKHYE